MYNVITPAGNVRVKTLAEAKEYESLYNYPYQKILERRIDHYLDDDYYLSNDELDTDAMGNCYSDADPGL